MEEVNAKPYYDFFSDCLPRVYCGNCGRILKNSEKVELCPWCGCEVDWSDD